MAGRFDTLPATDKGMWRRLLALVHPDSAGEHDLFVWCSMLREHVAGDVPDDARLKARDITVGQAEAARAVQFDLARMGGVLARALEKRPR